MEFRENAEGCLIDGSRYSARIYLDRVPWAELRCDSVKVFRMPLVSGLSMVDAEERLQGFTVRWDADPAGDRVECRVHAESSVWSGREFLWVFGPAMIRYRHTAAGRGKLGRCHFFSNGVSGLHDAGTSPGVDHNTWVYAARCFSPRANHGDMFYFPTSLPQSLGITNINAASGVYDPIQMSTGMFCPPPLQLIFGGGTTWVGVGIGEKPGLHLFNNFEYSGARFAGASFYVDYLGYRTIETGFTSPDAAIHFGFSEYDVLRQYVEWLDLSGFSTFNRFAPQPWHERPIFCGWGEQVAQGKMRGMRADDLSRQDNYTDWLSAIDARSLPVGTVVVDDKWQREYGLFRPDGTKWPDMKAFIAGQHARGRHVLLWIPVLHAEGLPPELCIRDGNDILAADITNPAYEELLRQGIRFLVRDMGADGFKEDWIRGFVTKPDVAMHEPMHGIEMLRRYQLIVHDEAHRHRQDALIETQTPHPLMRESSDMFRLNDIWFGSRDAGSTMATRARIGRLAGWRRIDCDGGCSLPLAEWWKYMRLQPEIGIPSLYLLTTMESTFEEVPCHLWDELRSLWEHYLDRRLLGK